MDDSIFKKPDKPAAESFFILTFQGKSQDDVLEYMNKLDPVTDTELLQAIFKKCEHRECRLRAGKIIYYNRF